MWNTTFIASSRPPSLVLRRARRLCLAELQGTALLSTTIFITYLVPQTLLFIPLSEIIRTYSLGDTPGH